MEKIASEQNAFITVDIIVCYNNEELFYSLEETVYKQVVNGCRCNIIGINNTDNTFKSAAAAYNVAFRKSTAECVIFCHQDILFLTGSLQTIAKICLEQPKTLWGAAGAREEGIISHIYEGSENRRYGTLAPGTEEKVQTLDECLIAGNRSLFEKIRFDEVICDSWHFYAVDLSLQCLLGGYEVKVFDANILHLSGGNVDASYWKTAKRLSQKYRGKIPSIVTTCSKFHTGPWLFEIDRMRYKVFTRIYASKWMTKIFTAYVKLQTKSHKNKTDQG